MNNKYKLIKIVGRKNKEGRYYKLALVLLITETDCDIVRILITDEQADKLSKVINDVNFDMTKYISIEYNAYQKSYQPKICY